MFGWYMEIAVSVTVPAIAPWPAARDGVAAVPLVAPGKRPALDGGRPVHLRPDEGDVLAGAHRLAEQLDAIAAVRARREIALGDRVAERQHRAGGPGGRRARHVRGAAVARAVRRAVRDRRVLACRRHAPARAAPSRLPPPPLPPAPPRARRAARRARATAGARPPRPCAAAAAPPPVPPRAPPAARRRPLVPAPPAVPALPVSAGAAGQRRLWALPPGLATTGAADSRSRRRYPKLPPRAIVPAVPVDPPVPATPPAPVLPRLRVRQTRPVHSQAASDIRRVRREELSLSFRERFPRRRDVIPRAHHIDVVCHFWRHLIFRRKNGRAPTILCTVVLPGTHLRRVIAPGLLFSLAGCAGTPASFRAGFPALADDVHGKGLKIGIAKVPGPTTCVGIYGGINPSVAVGSLGHGVVNAEGH